MSLIMTGGSRGIGQVAAEQLIGLPGAKIMGARRAATVPRGWEQRSLDLENLSSVRVFVDGLPNEPITHLILNAGGQRPSIDGRTVDGFETSFAANHLAHYLLLRLVMPRLAVGARIVITSSGTHDPLEKTGVPAPRHAVAKWLAHPELDPALDRRALVAGLRAYSSSKLCNLMTARFLASTAEARERNWTVLAYDPGFTPGTGLARDQSWIVRKLFWPLLPLFIPFAKGMNTLADAGRGLAELSTIANVPAGRVYASLRKGRLIWAQPSELARDDTVAAALWYDSARLVGLT